MPNIKGKNCEHKCNHSLWMDPKSTIFTRPHSQSVTEGLFTVSECVCTHDSFFCCLASLNVINFIRNNSTHLLVDVAIAQCERSINELFCMKANELKCCKWTSALTPSSLLGGRSTGVSGAASIGWKTNNMAHKGSRNFTTCKWKTHFNFLVSLHWTSAFMTVEVAWRL